MNSKLTKFSLDSVPLKPFMKIYNSMQFNDACRLVYVEL